MRSRLLAGLSAVAVFAALAFGQAPAATAAKTATEKTWTPQRTPDGQPDLQGRYTRNGVGGLEAHPPENPIDPSAGNPLSVSDRGDGLGPYPKVFNVSSLRGGPRKQRRTGIVDPADKNLPWRP